MKKKVIITSALTAALMLAGSIGGTFAWFTSEAKTDVNITAGKVNISSVVSDLKTYSLGVAQENGKFENGGTATLEEQTITLDKMTPGDKVTFKIKVTNNSDVKIKYRVAFRKTGALGSALVGGATGGASGWTPLEVGSQDIDLSASIELPENTGNEYQGKTGQVTVLVEAIQDNGVKAVASVADFEKAIKDIPAEGGDVSLYLSQDMTLSEVLEMPSNANVTIYGDGDTVLQAASGASRVINFDSVENTTLTLSGVTLNGPTSGTYTRGISLYGTKDCTVNLSDVTVNQPDYYAVNVASGNTGTVINIDGSNVQGWSALNIWSEGVTVNVKDSVLTGVNNHSGKSNAFSAIVFNAGAKNSKLNLTNAVVNTIQNGDQAESFFRTSDSGIEITSTNTTYNATIASETYSYPSIEEVLNENGYVRYNKDNAYAGTASIGFGNYFLEQSFVNDTMVSEVSSEYYLPALAKELAEEWETGYSISSTKVNGKQFALADYVA